jgi:hypothetical protein
VLEEAISAAAARLELWHRHGQASEQCLSSLTPERVCITDQKARIVRVQDVWMGGCECVRGRRESFPRESALLDRYRNISYYPRGAARIPIGFLMIGDVDRTPVEICSSACRSLPPRILRWLIPIHSGPPQGADGLLVKDWLCIVRARELWSSLRVFAGGTGWLEWSRPIRWYVQARCRVSRG